MCEWGTDERVDLNKPRPHSGNTSVLVDSCIASLVQELNDAGIVTTGCCCGHGKAPGWISVELTLEQAGGLLNSDDAEIAARDLAQESHGRRGQQEAAYEAGYADGLADAP